MNCEDVRTLFAICDDELLDASEREQLQGHLSACERCRVEHARYRQTVAQWVQTPGPSLSEAELWSRLESRLSDLPPEPAPGSSSVASEQPSRPRVALSCSYCHDGLVRDEAHYCASCLAPHHEDCFVSHGQCSVLACEETETIRPRSLGPTKSRRRSRVMAFLVGSVVGLTVTTGFYEWVQIPALEKRGDILSPGSLEEFKERLDYEKKYKESQEEVESLESAIASHNAEYRRLKELTRAPAVDSDGIEVEIPVGITLGEALGDLSGKIGRPVLADEQLKTRRIKRYIPRMPWRKAFQELARRFECFVDEDVYRVCFTYTRFVNCNAGEHNIRDLFGRIADAMPINLVLTDEVQGRTFASFKKVPWQQALEVLLNTESLIAQRQNNVMIVSRKSIGWGYKVSFPKGNEATEDGNETPSQMHQTVEIHDTENDKETQSEKIHFPIDTEFLSLRSLKHLELEDKSLILKVQVKKDYRFPLSPKVLKNPEELAGFLRASSNLTVELTDKALVITDIKSKDFFMASDVPAKQWLEAWSLLTGESVIVPSNWRQAVDLKLRGVSSSLALKLSCLQLHCEVQRVGPLIQIQRTKLAKQLNADPRETTNNRTWVLVLRNGRSLSVKLFATLGSTEDKGQRFAIINDEIVQEGQGLTNSATRRPHRGLSVHRIGPGFVEFAIERPHLNAKEFVKIHLEKDNHSGRRK